MAGVDPETLKVLLQFAEGKAGGGRGGGMRGGGGFGEGGELDPSAAFGLQQRNLATASHFAGLGRSGMGPSTSQASAFMGNRRAAAAEAYNNQFRLLEMGLRNAPALIKLLEHESAQGAFESGYKTAPPSNPESGFNPDDRRF